MAEKKIVKETTVSDEPSETTTHGERVEKPVKTEESHTLTHVVYWILGIIEFLLGFRFVLRVLGANPASGFVDGIYALTTPLIAPFKLIFGRVATEGVETTAVFEPETLIAMIVYGIVVIGIAKLVQVSSGRAHQEE